MVLSNKERVDSCERLNAAFPFLFFHSPPCMHSGEEENTKQEKKSPNEATAMDYDRVPGGVGPSGLGGRTLPQMFSTGLLQKMARLQIQQEEEKKKEKKEKKRVLESLILRQKPNPADKVDAVPGQCMPEELLEERKAEWAQAMEQAWLKVANGETHSLVRFVLEEGEGEEVLPELVLPLSFVGHIMELPEGREDAGEEYVVEVSAPAVSFFFQFLQGAVTLSEEHVENMGDILQSLAPLNITPFGWALFFQRCVLSADAGRLSVPFRVILGCILSVLTAQVPQTEPVQQNRQAACQVLCQSSRLWAELRLCEPFNKNPEQFHYYIPQVYDPPCLFEACAAYCGFWFSFLEGTILHGGLLHPYMVFSTQELEQRSRHDLHQELLHRCPRSNVDVYLTPGLVATAESKLTPHGVAHNLAKRMLTKFQAQYPRDPVQVIITDFTITLCPQSGDHRAVTIHALVSQGNGADLVFLSHGAHQQCVVNMVRDRGAEKHERARQLEEIQQETAQQKEELEERFQQMERRVEQFKEEARNRKEEQRRQSRHAQEEEASQVVRSTQGHYFRPQDPKTSRMQATTERLDFEDVFNREEMQEWAQLREEKKQCKEEIKKINKRVRENMDYLMARVRRYKLVCLCTQPFRAIFEGAEAPSIPSQDMDATTMQRFQSYGYSVQVPSDQLVRTPKYRRPILYQGTNELNQRSKFHAPLDDQWSKVKLRKPPGTPFPVSDTCGVDMHHPVDMYLHSLAMDDYRLAHHPHQRFMQ